MGRAGRRAQPTTLILEGTSCRGRFRQRTTYRDDEGLRYRRGGALNTADDRACTSSATTTSPHLGARIMAADNSLAHERLRALFQGPPPPTGARWRARRTTRCLLAHPLSGDRNIPNAS